MSASSLIFDSSGNIVSLVFLLMRGGGTQASPMLNVYQLIIAKIVISVTVLNVIFSLN